MANQELACVYAALILQDDEVPITGDKIATILKAAHVEVEPFWPGLFAKALEGVDVKALITNISTSFGGGGGVAAAEVAAPAATTAASAAAIPEEKENKKEEAKEESDDDMGFGLFD